MPSALRSLAASLLATTALGAIGPYESALPPRSKARFDHVAALRTKADFAGAAAFLEGIVTACPEDGDAWAELARARYDAGNVVGAIPAFEKALVLAGGFRFGYAYDLACCHGRLGHADEALAWLKKAMALGWRDLDFLRQDPDLALIRTHPEFKAMADMEDVSALSPAEGWRKDLHFLVREIHRRHPDPYRRVSKEAFDAYVADLDHRLPSLNEDQRWVSFTRLLSMAGDGHSEIWPSRLEPRHVPVTAYAFQEGWFISSTEESHRDLLGAQVLKISGHEVEKVVEAVKGVVSYDNAFGQKARVGWLLLRPSLLHGLDLLPDGTKVPILVKDRTGKEREAILEPLKDKPTEGRPTLFRLGADAPLWLQRGDAPYSFMDVPSTGLVYLQYNAVMEDPKDPLASFAARLAKRLADPAVTGLVVDLRWNGGGNSLLNRHLFAAIAGAPQNRPGRLFIIAGRETFSAAQNFATDLERDTDALFVGEPTGSSPAFIGETVGGTLPYSHMLYSLSDLRWCRAWPWDQRPWIAPDLPAAPSIKALREGRDPALEAILAYRKSNPF